MTEFLNRILNPNNKVSILEVNNDPFIKYHISQRSLQKPLLIKENT